MFVTQQLAQFAQTFAHAPLPDTVAHHTERALIDWYASYFPGLAMPAVQILAESLAEDLGHGASRLVDGRAATPRAAALFQGTAAHAAEVDDSFRDAMYHPGAATIAAALSMAHAVGADGPALLRSVVLGYEISTRIGVALGRPHYRFWHNTGTVGVFGAVSAAAGLLQLDEVAYANALAVAATFSAGLQQAFRLDAMSKPLHAGRAAEAGVLAAQLAARGMRSSLNVLEADGGLGMAMGKGGDWAQVARTLGEDFHITRLTFKNHIGCGHTFAAIDGALALQATHGFGHEDIERIELGVYRPTLDVAPHVDPATADEAKFSLHYMVATALVHGSVRLSAFEPNRLSDDATRALMQRISKALDPAVDAAFPGRRGARVQIALRDGRRLELLQPDRKGDPELPLSDRDLDGKFLELASPVVGQEPARVLLDRLWHLHASSVLP